MLKETVEKFWQIESENNFLNLKIDGIYFWPLIRFKVFTRVREKALSEQSANIGIGRVGLKESALLFLNATKNYFLNDVRSIRQKELLFYGHPRRKLLDDAYWWDIYIDPLLEELDSLNYNFIERTFNGKHFKPSKTENILHFDLFEYYARWKSKKSKFTFTKQDLQTVQLIEAKLYERFGTVVDVRSILSRELLLRKIYLPFFLNVLKKSKPNILFVTVSYSSQIIVEAAKLLEIPVVELQHGVISSLHVGYGYPEKFSSNFYPDYIFVFGEFWKKYSQLPIDDEKVLVTGYPYFTNNLKKIKSSNLVLDKNDQHLLFISQGSIGKELSQLAVDIKEAKPDLQVVYKLHAGEYKTWKKAYPHLQNSGVEVIDSDNIDFYEMMIKSSAIVGVYSTAIYEALGIGKKVYLLNLPSVKYVVELIENDFVKVINNCNELLEALTHSDSFNSDKIDPNYFFRSDWESAFEAAINTVLTSKLE